ncbi:MULTISPECIES: DUF5825 family protein [unclassified Bradyrhizobium]|uniref:DUF5825 family protein n=1 Tax=unclassified Bradyrhizobium TaxID=2631580 RepID=UPI0033936154
MGRVIIDRPIDLGAATELEIRRLRLVRDLTSSSIPVEWRLHGVNGSELTSFHHLSPPTDIRGTDCDLSAWREQFRYGLLYWRAGPGFISIRDARNGNVTVTTLSSAYAAAFMRCLVGDRLEGVDAKILQTLISDRVIMRLDGCYLSLAYRMRRWPIPCNAI